MHRKLGAVLASVLVIVAMGSALAFAAAAPADLGTERAGQQDGIETGNETAGNETGGNATDGNATDGNATDGNATGVNATDDNVTAGNATPGPASLIFGNQTSNGTAVNVTSVTLSEGGFVVIHDGTWFEGEPVTSVIGVSGYLENGTHDDVTVGLYRNVTGANVTRDALTTTDQLVAMPHVDSNGNESFDYVATNGSEDGPYLDADGEPIENVGVVAVEEADDAAADEPDEDEEVGIVGNISIGDEPTPTAANETTENETTADEDATGNETADEDATGNETTTEEPAGNESTDEEATGNESTGNES